MYKYSTVNDTVVSVSQVVGFVLMRLSKKKKKKKKKKQQQKKTVKDAKQSQLDSARTFSLYNCDPLKPHFCIVKLGFTGVYIIFLIFARKHRLWVLVRTASVRRF